MCLEDRSHIVNICIVYVICIVACFYFSMTLLITYYTKTYLHCLLKGFLLICLHVTVSDGNKEY